ncbi:hypothetical protein [Vibrio harveyi]|uniref:hypothetical protein n=1 Tax=Vibrio harveyi TaxID=669 RepID=UPI0002E837C5|nr:hypothetical protein [Vibrio harveyi]
MEDLDYKHAYIEMRKLLSLHLNVAIGDWLDSPKHYESPYREKMEIALVVSSELCDKKPEYTLEQHSSTINKLMACINTLKEAMEGTNAYIGVIPYAQIFSDVLNNSRTIVFDPKAPHATINLEMVNSDG